MQSPVPKAPWTGVLKTHAPGNICLQNLLLRVTGNEDCLSLNVYTPHVGTCK